MKFKIQKDVRKQLFVCFFMYIGNFIGGIGVAWSSPMVVKLQDAEETPLQYIITDGQASWVASLAYVGCIVGPHISGKLSDIIGRKYCLLLGGLLSTLAYCLLTFANNLAMIYAGRILVGSAAGLVLVTNIVLISEIASPYIRGFLLTFTGIFQALGSLFSHGVGPFLSYSTYHYVILGLHGAYLVGFVFIPESPVFHVMKGQIEKAQNIFKILERTKDRKKELDAIAENIQRSNEQKQILQIQELFSVRSNRKGFIICLALLLLQNCGGINSISMFSLTIFQNAGTAVSPAVANIIFGTAQVFGTLIAPVFIEKSGRRILLVASTVGCSVSMCLMGLYFYLDYYEHDAIPNLGWLPLVAMLAALLSYNSGLSIVPNSLVGEVFRSNIRSIGSSICISLGFLGGFGVTLSFGYILAGMGMFISFFVFACINAIGVIFILLLVPETKGMTLIEIQDLLSK